MAKKKSSLGEDIYSGTATFGRIEAIFGSIVSTLIGLVIMAVGIAMLRHKSHLQTVEGKVTQDSSCSTSTNCDKDKNCVSGTSCITHVDYVLNGKTYSEVVSTGFGYYSKGDGITIYYDPNNPSKAEGPPLPSFIGWTAIAFGIIIIVGGWVWVYITQKSKAAAAIGGIAAGARMIRS